MKNQPSERSVIRASHTGKNRFRPPVESARLTLLSFYDYAKKKRFHLKYLVGKLAFKLRYWSCELLRPSYYTRRLNELMLKFHGMELGILRQYGPRPIQSFQLPVSQRRITKLPTIAIVTASYNQGDLIAYTIEILAAPGFSGRPASSREQLSVLPKNEPMIMN